jgi:hypothetical protein
MKVKFSQVSDVSITSAQIADGTITAADLGAASVNTAALAANAVDLTKISAAAQASLKGKFKTIILTTLACSIDGARVSNTNIPADYLQGGLLQFSAGVDMTLGDGTKTFDFYCSAPGTSGAAARTHANIVAGDEIYANCLTSVHSQPGGFAFAAGDFVVLKYSVA